MAEYSPNLGYNLVEGFPKYIVFIGKIKMEASSGIEPLYTDLQSCHFPFDNKSLSHKRYQDKTGPSREPDTPHISSAKTETAAPSAKGTAASKNIKGGKPSQNQWHKSQRFTTGAFFWDRRSNSVQPVCEIAGAVLS